MSLYSEKADMRSPASQSGAHLEQLKRDAPGNLLATHKINGIHI